MKISQSILLILCSRTRRRRRRRITTAPTTTTVTSTTTTATTKILLVQVHCILLLLLLSSSTFVLLMLRVLLTTTSLISILPSTLTLSTSSSLVAFHNHYSSSFATVVSLPPPLVITGTTTSNKYRSCFTGPSSSRSNTFVSATILDKSTTISIFRSYRKQNYQRKISSSTSTSTSLSLSSTATETETETTRARNTRTNSRLSKLQLSSTSTSTTYNGSSNNSDSNNNSNIMIGKDTDPRIRSAILMAVAMALHYGGYEFVRNSILALFTSSSMGYTSSGAYPLANGLVSPFSVILLYLYGIQLQRHGPQRALAASTIASIGFIVLTSVVLQILSVTSISNIVSFGSITISKRSICQILIGISFLFQNSYNYLLASQQWSFVNSILTPEEGSKWFTIFTGTTSLVCTITGTLVPLLIPYTGLLGLYGLTSITLLATLIFQNRAYNLARQNGFDPSNNNDDNKMKVGSTKSATETKKSLSSRGIDVFKKVPTLRALFMEVVSFQSLNTVLTIAFVDCLKNTIIDDTARGSYSSQFYALINGSSAMLQFFLLPLFMKKIEPKTVWKLMPIIPFLVCTYQILHTTTTTTTTTLTLLAFAVYVTKTMDYSIRSVVYNMVYQPLDFDSRYVGKEIISVIGSRFGKSGMSLAVSTLSYLGMNQLSSLSWMISSLWITSTWWLSTLLPTKKRAQQIVEERIQTEKQQQQLQQQSSSSADKKKIK